MRLAVGGGGREVIWGWPPDRLSLSKIAMDDSSGQREIDSVIRGPSAPALR